VIDIIFALIEFLNCLNSIQETKQWNHVNSLTDKVNNALNSRVGFLPPTAVTTGQIEPASLTVYNRMTSFEWDADKAELNFRKHRVSFEEAETAILDELSKTTMDPDHSFTENRFITFGVSARQRLLVVSYTHRGDSIRIISARTATKQEREIYEEH
jgi:uncharacterized DUF497 family protein